MVYVVGFGFTFTVSQSLCKSFGRLCFEFDQGLQRILQGLEGRSEGFAGFCDKV